MKAYTVNNHLVGVGNDQILGTDQGGGVEYEAGQYISIDENNVISVTGVAPATAIPDTSDMATKTWVTSQGYLTEVPSNYATDTEVSQAIASSVTDFVTEDQVTALIPETEDVTFEELDLSNYALASAIPAAQVNSDWNANSGVAEILNKPTEIQLIAGTNVQIEVSGVSAVISAQGGGGTQVQSDWTETDTSDPSYIQNKPTEKNLVAGANVTITESNDEVTIETTEIASGLQLVAGKGVVLSVTGNQIIASVDETVLADNIAYNATSFTLSEPAGNFDRLVIYGTYSNRAEIIANNSRLSWSAEFISESDGYKRNRCYCVSSSDGIHWSEVKVLGYDQPNATTINPCGGNDWYLETSKIVGINRIAGGN